MESKGYTLKYTYITLKIKLATRSKCNLVSSIIGYIYRKQKSCTSFGRGNCIPIIVWAKPWRNKDKMESKLVKVSESFYDHKLPLNKSCFLAISKKRIWQNLNIKNSTKPLLKIDWAKYLGLYNDDKLTWNRHIHPIFMQKISAEDAR